MGTGAFFCLHFISFHKPFTNKHTLTTVNNFRLVV